MSWKYFISIVEDPARIRDRFPHGAPWEGHMITPVHVLVDGVPRNDPESGRFEVPRIRDPRITRTAAVVALPPEQVELLNGPSGEGAMTLAEALGLKLYASHEAAWVAHPEMAWDRLSSWGDVGLGPRPAGALNLTGQ